MFVTHVGWPEGVSPSGHPTLLSGPALHFQQRDCAKRYRCTSFPVTRTTRSR